MARHGAAEQDRPLDVGETAWEEALRRAEVIRPLVGRRRAGNAVVAHAARALNVSPRQVYRLISVFRANPVTASLVGKSPGPGKGGRRLPAAVEAAIERGIESFYKTREKPGLEALHRRVRHDCIAAGLQPPSMKALSARVDARGLKEMVRAREGADAARDRFSPAVGGIRTTAPLQVVQIDHTPVDIQLVDDLLRGVLGRPWLTLVLEIHTRCVLGFLVTFDAPSAAGVAMAVAHAVLPKAGWLAARALEVAWPMQGCPGVIHLDNAPEFHSKALERGCQRHGFRLAYRDRGTPHHGGHVERLMGTLMGRIHALPGTTFSNIAERGDYPSEARAVLTLGGFERVFALEVLGPYHNDVHSALGKAPAAAWAEWIAAGGQPALPRDPGAFVPDFLPFRERVVRREGIRMFNIHYYDGALASLIGTGATLRVKYDPRDLSAVFAEMPGGGHLRVPYADLSRRAITLWEHRSVVRRLHAEGRRTIDEQVIFAAVGEQRRTLAEAYAKSRQARRAAARGVGGQFQGLASAAPPPPPPAPEPVSDAEVPLPTEDDIAAAEFWS
jgi:putative transposase